MQHINVPFDDDEAEELAEVKGDRTWRRAILEEFGVFKNKQHGGQR